MKGKTHSVDGAVSSLRQKAVLVTDFGTTSRDSRLKGYFKDNWNGNSWVDCIVPPRTVVIEQDSIGIRLRGKVDFLVWY